MTVASEGRTDKHAWVWLTSLALMAMACTPAATAPPLVPAAEERLPPGAVQAARGPYYALDASGRLDESALLARLSNATLVCLGEQHDNPTHHALQLQLVKKLQAAAQQRGVPFALGLEMFQLPAQPALDAYSRFEIDEAMLVARSEYASRWGYDFELYRPMLEHVRAGGGTLLALNAPREWTKAVARKGLSALAELTSTPKPSELDLNDQQHRAFFMAAMAGHGHGHKAPQTIDSLGSDPYYAAQVLWDEVMARTASRWLVQAPAGAQLVILAGAGHCHRSAILRRVERRIPQATTLGVRLSEQSAIARNPVPSNSAFDMLVVAVQP